VRDYALEICHRDGRLTPVLYNASVYRDESGKVIESLPQPGHYRSEAGGGGAAAGWRIQQEPDRGEP